MDAGDEDGGDVGVTREDAAILMTLKHGTKRKRRRGLNMRARSSAPQVQGCGGSQICEHGRRALSARSAVVLKFASTAVSALSARSAVGLKSARARLSALVALCVRGRENLGFQSITAAATRPPPRRPRSHLRSALRPLCTSTVRSTIDVEALHAKNASHPKLLRSASSSEHASASWLPAPKLLGGPVSAVRWMLKSYMSTVVGALGARCGGSPDLRHGQLTTVRRCLSRGSNEGEDSTLVALRGVERRDELSVPMPFIAAARWWTCRLGQRLHEGSRRPRPRPPASPASPRLAVPCSSFLSPLIVRRPCLRARLLAPFPAPARPVYRHGMASTSRLPPTRP